MRRLGWAHARAAAHVRSAKGRAPLLGHAPRWRLDFRGEAALRLKREPGHAAAAGRAGASERCAKRGARAAQQQHEASGEEQRALALVEPEFRSGAAAADASAGEPRKAAAQALGVQQQSRCRVERCVGTRCERRVGMVELSVAQQAAAPTHADEERSRSRSDERRERRRRCGAVRRACGGRGCWCCAGAAGAAAAHRPRRTASG
jgi:hypothetical protein